MKLSVTSNASNVYTYGDAAHKHAVTAAFGNSYGYDANGNQTTRTISGVAYTFTYDYENRVTAIAGGSTSASFVYDADGNRVKGTVNGVTTIYVAGQYEYQAGATTHYYEGNAMRRTGYATDNGVIYLLQDHLKSSSAMINQNGTVNSQNYYLPFGGNRGATFNNVTTKRFTGQYHEKDLPGGEGLSYYGARWYDAQIGRFVSPDTIVPEAEHPQAFNRYSYVLNNPLKFVDPTGHCASYNGKPDYNDGECWRYAHSILNLWDRSKEVANYWNTLYTSKEIFMQMALSDLNADFFKGEMERFERDDVHKAWLKEHEPRPVSEEERKDPMCGGDSVCQTLVKATEKVEEKCSQIDCVGIGNDVVGIGAGALVLASPLCGPGVVACAGAGTYIGAGSTTFGILWTGYNYVKSNATNADLTVTITLAGKALTTENPKIGLATGILQLIWDMFISPDERW